MKTHPCQHIALVTALLISCSYGALAKAETSAKHPAKPKASDRLPLPFPANRPSSTRQHKTLTPRMAAPEELSVQASRSTPHGSKTVLTAKMLERSVPGTNPLKVLAAQPGVMFQSDDPQGMDTWSNQFYMHGFMQNQIGMTLDGIPLGDQEFHSANGLSNTAAISSENIGHMDVSMSAGAEAVASTSNLGGSVEYFSADPSHKRGGTIAQTFGSNATYHTFVRLESGDLNKTGTRFYTSYMRNDLEKWKGGGNQFAQQVNAKLLQPIGQNSKFSVLFDYDEKQLQNYQDMSFDMLENGGYNLDNFYGVRNGYAKAYRSALSLNGLPGGSLPAGYNKMSDPWDASYYDSATLSRDYLGGANLDLALTDRLRWKTVVYGHGQYGRAAWTNPYQSSPADADGDVAPLSEQITISHSQRYGVTSGVTYNVAHNVISAGVWYENFHNEIGRNGYALPVLGKGEPFNSMGSLPSPYTTYWGQSFNSNSFTAYVQDTYHPLANISLHFGFKSLLQTVRGGEDANLYSYTNWDGLAAGSMTTAKAFLPHISGDWHFLRHHELFFDVAENVKSYPVSAYKEGPSPWAVSQSTFNQIRGGLRPETDWNYAVGYRFNDKLISASLYAYHTDFHNRIQQISSGTIINPVFSVANVGNVNMNGVDAGITLRPIKGLELINTVSYNHATYGSNIVEQGVAYATHGQQIVNYPRFMYKGSISYTWHGVDMHVDTQYIGKRNFSYTGDMKVPSYWVETLGARYQFGNMGRFNKQLGFMKNLTFSFDIYNLTNRRYIATMGEEGNPMQGDYQSFLVGAPRQFFGSLKADF